MISPGIMLQCSICATILPLTETACLPIRAVQRAETKSEIDANFVGQKRPTQRQPKKTDRQSSVLQRRRRRRKTDQVSPILLLPLSVAQIGIFSAWKLLLLRVKVKFRPYDSKSAFHVYLGAISKLTSGLPPRPHPPASESAKEAEARARRARRRVCPLLIHQQSKQPQLAYRERTTDQLLPFFPPNILLLLLACRGTAVRLGFVW